MKRFFMAILALTMAVNMMAGDFVKVKEQEKEMDRVWHKIRTEE